MIYECFFNQFEKFECEKLLRKYIDNTNNYLLENLGTQIKANKL